MNRNLQIKKIQETSIRIKYLVGEARINEAIEQLEEFVVSVENKDIANQFTAIKSRKSSEIIKYINGVKEGDITDNNINFAINLFTDKVEKIALEKVSLEGRNLPNLIDKNKLIAFCIVGILSFLAGWLINDYKGKNVDPITIHDTIYIYDTIDVNSPKHPYNEYVPFPRRAISNGKTKAIIELGATGFNYFIVDIDKSKNWNLKKPKFGVSLAKEGLITSEIVLNKIADHISDIAGYGVSSPVKNNIHFVVSSGAMKAQNITNVIKGIETQYHVNRVSAEEEAKYGFLASVPQNYLNSSFFIDVGSGNTKIAWNDGNEIITKETYGSKSFQENTDTATVIREIKNIIKQIPAQNRVNCIVIGGAAFKIAQAQRKLPNEKFTILNLEIFNPEGMQEQFGKIIINSIQKESSCDNIIFDWDSNFSIGFLVFSPQVPY